jgi:hypothetical protein
MWMTVLIAGGLFVAMLAMLWLNFEDVERRRTEEGTGPIATAPAAPGHCMLCEGPLPERRTTDQVVFELEHRIHADLQDIDRLLRTDPHRVERLYAS